MLDTIIISTLVETLIFTYVQQKLYSQVFFHLISRLYFKCYCCSSTLAQDFLYILSHVSIPLFPVFMSTLICWSQYSQNKRMNTVNSKDLGQCNLGYKCVCMHTHASMCVGRQANRDIHFIFESLRRGLLLLNMQSMFIYCFLFIFFKKDFFYKQIYQ